MNVPGDAPHLIHRSTHLPLVNDVLMHAGVPTAPFGGVGEFGYGSYHGSHGFRTFSHSRVVVSPRTWLDALLVFRYPPFDAKPVPKVAVRNTLGFKRRAAAGPEDQGEEGWEDRSASARVGCGCGADGAG